MTVSNLDSLDKWQLSDFVTDICQNICLKYSN